MRDDIEEPIPPRIQPCISFLNRHSLIAVRVEFHSIIPTDGDKMTDSHEPQGGHANW